MTCDIKNLHFIHVIATLFLCRDFTHNCFYNPVIELSVYGFYSLLS